VLALLPALKLVLGRPRIDAALGLGLAALALYWGPLLAWQDAKPALDAAISFAWAPLLVGLVLRAGDPD